MENEFISSSVHYYNKYLRSNTQRRGAFVSDTVLPSYVPNCPGHNPRSYGTDPLVLHKAPPW